MKKLSRLPFIALLLVTCCSDDGCERHDSDSEQSKAQEKILADGVASVGLPAIKNHREMRLLKDIFELRDQDGIVTYTYLFTEQTGKLIFLCDSIGYGLPAATQFTNPQKLVNYYDHNYTTLPQADPNGLFSPSSAEGTWVVCKDPGGKDVRVVYAEPRIIVSPFKLAE